MVASLVFLIFNWHHLLLKGLIDSFHVYPIGTFALTDHWTVSVPAEYPFDWPLLPLGGVELNGRDDALSEFHVVGIGDIDKDIDRAGEALKDAASARIHTFIATSPVHMERKLRMSPDQVVEQAVWAVKRARAYTDDVEFSAEDAGRSELDFLCRIFEAVIAAGATTINVPDTVGYNLPTQFGETMRQLLERIPNSDPLRQEGPSEGKG